MHERIFIRIIGMMVLCCVYGWENANWVWLFGPNSWNLIEIKWVWCLEGFRREIGKFERESLSGDLKVVKTGPPQLLKSLKTSHGSPLASCLLAPLALSSPATLFQTPIFQFFCISQTEKMILIASFNFRLCAKKNFWCFSYVWFRWWYQTIRNYKRL